MDKAIYIILLGLLVIAHLLPLSTQKHWFFRVWDFGRIQLCFLQLATFLLGFHLIISGQQRIWIGQFILLTTIIHNLFILIRYTPFYRVRKSQGIDGKQSAEMSLLSINVHQFNQNFDSLIDLVNNLKPDILLTIETNHAWEEALSVLQDSHPFTHKVALENTYGMHLFSRIKIEHSQTHYFVSNDIPSFEAHLQTIDGFSFVLWGVHPPPPSPTEQKNSRERDGELMSIAKVVRVSTQPTIVVGDFNTVVWSKTSRLFRKTSQLLDPRMGRGFISTYPARYKFLRCPIDLIFHTPQINVKKLGTQPSIGSDHLPIYCLFFIHEGDFTHLSQLNEEERKEIHKHIREGKREPAKRPSEAEPNIGDLIAFGF